MHNLETIQIESLLFDAMILYKDYGYPTQAMIGITRGGAEFVVTENVRQIEYDGRRGRTMGMENVDQIDASLKVKTLEITQENMFESLGAAELNENGAISNTNGGVIPVGRYLHTLTGFGILNKSGVFKKVTLKNAAACNNGGLTLSTSDKNEAELEMTFNAAWNPLDITEKIYTIEDTNSAPSGVMLRPLTVSCEDGTTGTIVTILQSARTGMGFVYKDTSSEPTAPEAGDVITGGTAIISGADISTSNKYYVAIYEVDAGGHCYGYGVARAVVA